MANALQPVKGFAFADAFVTKLSPTAKTFFTRPSSAAPPPRPGTPSPSTRRARRTSPGRPSRTTSRSPPRFDSTPGISGEAFVSKLSADGSQLSFSTYFGGGGSEQGTGIAVDAANNIYVTGSTSSNNDLLLVNPTQSTFGGDANTFLARFNTDTSTLDFSTYLGGGSADTANAVAVDAQGSAYIVGTTTSANFPTANPLPALAPRAGRLRQ